jgi:hypothetical protein
MVLLFVLIQAVIEEFISPFENFVDIIQKPISCLVIICKYCKQSARERLLWPSATQYVLNRSASFLSLDLSCSSLRFYQTKKPPAG